MSSLWPDLVVGVLMPLAVPLAALSAHRFGRHVSDLRVPRMVWALGYAGLVAAVGAVPQGRLGTVVALVVASPARELDPEAVKAFARERLAAYKYPRRVVVVRELPKGPTGKILKRAIDVAALTAVDPHSPR